MLLNEFLTGDDHGANKDTALDSSKTETPGHQGDKNSGGTRDNYKVLWCQSLKLDCDYEVLYDSFKGYGKILRIKLKLDRNGKSFHAFITFDSHASALKAYEGHKDKSVGESKCFLKIFRCDNIEEDEYDFIPKERLKEDLPTRNSPEKIWFVASYKQGCSNMIHAVENIEGKIGSVPKGNIKKYGRNILIKAGNKAQTTLLSRFKPSIDGNISKVEAHKSFNHSRGVIYSQDLYEFTEEEILQRCPPSVFQVRKLKGNNNAILIFFSRSFIPDHIDVSHSRITVKPYRQQPRQCYKCLEFGHVAQYCQISDRCHNCSSYHGKEESCTKFCINCNEVGHSPTSKKCLRYRFEQSILETAYNERISIGSAKRKIMGANKDPSSTYASVVKNIKRVQVTGKTDATRPSSDISKSETALPETSTSTGSKPKANSDPLHIEVQVDVHNSFDALRVLTPPSQLPTEPDLHSTLSNIAVETSETIDSKVTSSSPEPKRPCKRSKHLSSSETDLTILKVPSSDLGQFESDPFVSMDNIEVDQTQSNIKSSVECDLSLPPPLHDKPLNVSNGKYEMKNKEPTLKKNDKTCNESVLRLGQQKVEKDTSHLKHRNNKSLSGSRVKRLSTNFSTPVTQPRSKGAGSKKS